MIEGSVAQVITPTKIVLNIGRSAGVETFMCFAVYVIEKGHLHDAETGEDPGSQERIKAFVEATTVLERVTYANRIFNPDRKLVIRGLGKNADIQAGDLVRLVDV